MPPHHEFDHKIHLENDQMPPPSHIYPLSGTELSLLGKFLDYMLSKGFIQSSQLPVGTPVLFAKKKDGTCNSVSTSETSTISLRRISTQFHLSPISSTNWAAQRSTPSSTSMLATTMFMSQLAMSGRQPSEHDMVPSSSWSCQWDSPMLRLCSKPL